VDSPGETASRAVDPAGAQVPHLRLTLWPQDFYFLTWLLVIAALACSSSPRWPGAVLRLRLPADRVDETFLWMERLSRQPLAADEAGEAPWTADKVPAQGRQSRRCGSLLAVDRFTFVGYFTPITELAGKIASFAPARGDVLVLFYGGATYVNARLHARAGLQVHVP